jgi:hypothetical protein
MTDRYWDPFGSRKMFAALWSPSTSPMTSGPTSGFGALFSTLRRHFVGRELTVGWARGAVRLTVVTFDAHPDPRGLSVGQFGDVVAVANDVTFENLQLSRVNAVLQNAHVRPGSPAQLVAAPVHLHAELPNELLAKLTRRFAGPISAEVDDDGVGRLVWARYAQFGYLEVDPAIMGATLTLRARHLVVRGYRWSLPRWVPRYSVALPSFHGMLITDITLRPGSVSLSATLPEWTFDLPRIRWEDIIAKLSSTGGRLNLSRGPRVHSDAEIASPA